MDNGKLVNHEEAFGIEAKYSEVSVVFMQLGTLMTRAKTMATGMVKFLMR